jgi:hypothetical protein
VEFVYLFAQKEKDKITGNSVYSEGCRMQVQNKREWNTEKVWNENDKYG